MTDKAQARIRFFAAYIGEEVIVQDGDRDHRGELVGVSIYRGHPKCMMHFSEYGTHNYDLDLCQLLLKPLSEMTEEDAFSLAKYMGWDSLENAHNAKQFAMSYFHSLMSRTSNEYFIESVDLADFLRSRGYLLDFMGYDPIAEGWAVLTTES